MVKYAHVLCKMSVFKSSSSRLRLPPMHCIAWHTNAWLSEILGITDRSLKWCKYGVSPIALPSKLSDDDKMSIEGAYHRHFDGLDLVKPAFSLTSRGKTSALEHLRCMVAVTDFTYHGLIDIIEHLIAFKPWLADDLKEYHDVLVPWFNSNDTEISHNTIRMSDQLYQARRGRIHMTETDYRRMLWHQAYLDSDDCTHQSVFDELGDDSTAQIEDKFNNEEGYVVTVDETELPKSIDTFLNRAFVNDIIEWNDNSVTSIINGSVYTVKSA